MNHTEATTSLIQAFKQAGQGQVFSYFDQLDAAEQAQLLEQAASIDLAEVATLVDEHVKGEHTSAVDLEGLTPAPYTALPVNGGDATQWSAAFEAGSAAIAAGRFLALSAARGPGTRLG